MFPHCKQRLEAHSPSELHVLLWQWWVSDGLPHSEFQCKVQLLPLVSQKNLGPQTFRLASNLWHKFSHGMARAHEGHALSPSHRKRQHVGHMYVREVARDKKQRFPVESPALHERWHICCATACGSADVFYAQGRSVSPLLYKRYTLRLSKNDFAEVAHGLCYKEYFAREASASDSTMRSSA